MKHCNSPIYDALVKYAEQMPTAFHMPGHKMGKGFPEGLYKDFFKLDLTELPGLDNLHSPSGVIKAAQELAAKAFFADHTFFLVNGATSGIHAMVMTACKKGDKLLVARDCHKAVINAMIMSGVEPIYILPDFNKEFAISETISADAVRKALEEHPEAAGLFVTRPSYYGICTELGIIEKLVHTKNKLLLVDEAHGPHLPFCSELPESAMQLNADMCVQSAHKTLPALTQGAYLHTKGSRVDLDKLKYNLSMLLTTSPSYLIMSSLDVAREIMQLNGNELLKKLLGSITVLRNGFDSIKPLKLLHQKHLTNKELDGTRIVIGFSDTGMSGFEAERLLRSSYNIQVEMSDLYSIVLITTIADRQSDFDRLFEALRDISVNFVESCKKSCFDFKPERFLLPGKALLLSETLERKSIRTELDRVVGKISKQMVVPYPPGIPVICPGEVFSSDVVQMIKEVMAYGGLVQGVDSCMGVEVLA